MPKKLGRRKRSRNKGYFFRSGRGWFTKHHGQFIPLTDDQGEKIRDEQAAGVPEAYARHRLSVAKEATVALGKSLGEGESTASTIEVGTVVAAYLSHLKAQATGTDGILPTNPTGVAKTYRDRGQTLFDFCYGLPGEYFCDGNLEKRAAKGGGESKRLHEGFGAVPCRELRPTHVDLWLEAHRWNANGRRTRLQALKRAFNFGVERQLIPVSPIKGYKLPTALPRVTYLTPEQEQALLAASTPAFKIALRVCIRTGARFGCEFAALTAQHVHDEGQRMRWIFKPEESKTGRKTGRSRFIYITDPEILELVRDGLRQHPGGHVFRSMSGQPWTRAMLSQNFRRGKSRLAAQGLHLDDDACMYSCRHTFAKRVLEGYWSGRPASIESLAKLMGNTVDVCIKHYLQFSVADTDRLWNAI